MGGNKYHYGGTHIPHTQAPTHKCPHTGTHIEKETIAVARTKTDTCADDVLEKYNQAILQAMFSSSPTIRTCVQSKRSRNAPYVRTMRPYIRTSHHQNDVSTTKDGIPNLKVARTAHGVGIREMESSCNANKQQYS